MEFSNSPLGNHWSTPLPDVSSTNQNCDLPNRVLLSPMGPSFQTIVVLFPRCGRRSLVQVSKGEQKFWKNRRMKRYIQESSTKNEVHRTQWNEIPRQKSVLSKIRFKVVGFERLVGRSRYVSSFVSKSVADLV